MTKLPAPEAGSPAQGTHALPTLGWALKRTAIGVLLLIFIAGGGALLLHASIEPEANAKGLENSPEVFEHVSNQP